MIASAIFSCFASLSAGSEDERQEMLQSGILMGLPALCVAALLLLSYKQIWFAETLTPVFAIGFTSMIIVINYTTICGELSISMAKHQGMLAMVIYLLLALFMGGTWLQHMIVRFVFLFGTLTMATVIRLKMGDREMNMA